MIRSRARRQVLPLVVAVVLAGSTVALTTTMVERGHVDQAAVTHYSLPSVPAPAEPLSLPQQPRVLLMGDSYTEGWGADPESDGFAYKIAAPLGWRLTRDGIGSTGYVDAGLGDQGNYPVRLDRHPRDAYDLVILQGGTNDEKLSTAQISTGVDTTVQVVRERYPHAQLLVVGPVAPYGTASDDRAKLNLALVDYTHEHSIAYMNTIAEHWFLTGEWRTLVNQAKGHPNNAGYVRVAERFVGDIRALERPANTLGS